MRHLITGGAGFIGSHLAEHLVSGGDEVFVIDDLSTGRVEHLRSLRDHPRFTLATQPLLSGGLLRERAEWADCIHHLAAVVGIRRRLQNPLEALRVNLRGTAAVLDAAGEGGTRVLLASTGEVYGKSAARLLTEEEDLVLGPTTRGSWGFAASRILDELEALAWHEERRLPVTVVRLFNTTGPRQRALQGGVLPTFVRQAIAGEPLTVHGNGEQVRTFACVREVVACWDRLAATPQSVGEVYNLGSDDEVSIRDLATLVTEVVRSSSTIETVPHAAVYPAGYEEAPRRVPSLTKLEGEIGLRPVAPIRRIVEGLVAHERQRVEA